MREPPPRVGHAISDAANSVADFGEASGGAGLVGCVGVGAAGAAGFDLEEGYSHYKQNAYEGD